MPTMSLEQAPDALAEIIDRLPPGEEVVLTRGGQPVATIRAAPRPADGPRRFGTLRGSVLAITPDFDAVPDGFEDYLP
jgi:antitoxin (DNA-binding transcriptional repressor) of toxin-antitoxin stability system